MHKTVSKGRAIIDRILINTAYTGIYEDPPEESRRLAKKVETFVQTPTPCPQRIAEPKYPTLDPKPINKDHQPFFLSMFDDYESTVGNDVSSLPREESEVYEESEVVTPDPEEESLSDNDQVKEDSSLPDMEFRFLEDEFEFLNEEFKAPVSLSSS